MTSERHVYKYFAAPFLLLGLSNIASNGLLCHVLRKLRKLQTMSYRFILIQSSADIFAGVILLATEIVLQFDFDDDSYEKILVFSRIFCDAICQFSGTMILVVAIDRYIHMKYLTKYNTMMTSKRGMILIFNNLGSCVSMAIVNIFGVLYGYYSGSHLFMNFLAVSVYTTTFIVYYKAYRSITRRVNEMNTENEVRAAKRPSRNKEFARAVAIILIVLAVCYTPFVAVSTVKVSYRCKPCDRYTDLLIAFYCTRILVCSTSTINAVLFIMFNRELKNYILRRNGANADSQLSQTT